MLNLVKRPDGGLEPFTTKTGHKYTFMAPGSPISVHRWTEYEKLNIVFGFNRTFSQIYESIGEAEKLVNADKPFHEIRRELTLMLNSMKAGVVEESKTRYNHAFYLCTIFCLVDDQKPHEWSIEKAEETIKDWSDNDVSEQDLFFFALQVSSGIKAALKNQRDEIRDRTVKLSGLGGTPNLENTNDI